MGRKEYRRCSTVFEGELSTRSDYELIATVAALRRHFRGRTWRVEEAQLVAEIREELVGRGYPSAPLRRLFGGPTPSASHSRATGPMRRRAGGRVRG
jgi:hypothetical protein